MKDKKTISVGDIMWVEPVEQLIEIIQLGRPDEMIAYWHCKSQVGTKKCKTATPWVLFRHAEKVGFNSTSEWLK